jgi:NTP pyrophosphatase (non-canonical NTP hydrolase)
MSMKLSELIEQYQAISTFLNEEWPLKDKNHRTFARMMKLFEELGELSDEILTSMNLQRSSKVAKFSHQNVEDEFAEVLASVLLLAIELDIDVEEVIQRKIDFTNERFGLGTAENDREDLAYFPKLIYLSI